MTSGQYIDYETLAQEAMRGIIRAVLAKVAGSGGTLYGDHHFYIAFNTQAPGVILSKRLREKYPVEMTIVLQHRFWDLEVGDDRFEVKLTFDGIPERLAIPYRSIKVFYDPSVPYGLQFEESELAARTAHDQQPRVETDAQDPAGDRSRVVGLQPGGERQGTRSDGRPRRTRPQRTEKPDRAEAPSSPVAAPQAAAPIERPASRPADEAPVDEPAAVKPARPALADVKADDGAAGPDAGPAPEDGGKVVDFSKFRKK